MDTDAADVVHPEVRAHITSLVSALGGFDEDGQYQLGDDALEVLRDIKKWIQFYDQKLNRMDVARCVAETNLVGADMLAILATWHAGATLQRYRARVALAVYELLVPLTWPLDKDGDSATVNYYRHLPVLQLAQVAYKRAIINYDGAQILHTAVRVALPSMAVPMADRTLRDQGIIRLVLFFLRNMAMIEPPAGVVYDGDESQVSRSATIDAFAYQDIFLVLLTMASNMGDDFRDEDAIVMETIFHLVKGVDTARLFMDEQQLGAAKASELTDMMQKEEALLGARAHHKPTRHSRFGTTIWVDRGAGKMSVLTGQDALRSAAVRDQKLDQSKRFRPPKRARKPVDATDLVGPGARAPLHARAYAQLRTFVASFLDSGFNPLFVHVRKSLDREAPHVLHHHRAQFFYLVAWFLSAERERRSKTKTKTDISSFNLVAGVLGQEMLVFLGRALDRSVNDRDWKELSVVMRCYTQILLTVQDMYESGRDDDEEIAENMLSRLFYEEATHDAVANIARSYKDQGLDYLDACTELVHTYLRILEAYAKQNVDLQVRSRRRTRTKKRAAKAAAGDTAPASDDSADDEAHAHKTSSERTFDFKRVAARFATQGVVDTFVQLARAYADLTDAQLKRAHRFFYRVAFKQDMGAMLFRVDIVKLLHDMVRGPDALDRHRPVFCEWEDLAKHVLRKCLRKIEERPVLIIEMLFSKTPNTAHFLEHGFEKQTLTPKTPRPAAEHEFRDPALGLDRQIAILVSILLNKNQHELLAWTKAQIGMAAAERRAWRAAEHARAEAEAETSTSTSTEAPTITVRPSDETVKKALFKNAHLRLLLKVVGIERMSPQLDETPESVWVVPGRVTASELEEALELIAHAEFAPPSFDGEQAAEDQLRRKPAARKKVEVEVDDDFLFPAGGPTARKVVDAPKRKKAVRRRRKDAADLSDNELSDGDDDDDAAAVRAAKRREKEREKARRVKSDAYVHASDDETDDEKDRAFFAREEATRKRIKALAMLVEAEGPQPVAAPAKSKTNKRKEDEDDDEEDEEDDDSDSSGRSRKRRKPSVERASDDAMVAEPAKAAPRRTRALAGFVDSDDDDSDDGEAATSMDVDTPPAVLGEIAPNAVKGVLVDDDDDDDDDDDVPVKLTRRRPKGGFLADSDDE